MLEGARKTIEACKPVLLIEIADDSEEGSNSGAQVFKMLDGLHYAAYGVEGARLEPCDGPCGKVDYLFVQPDQVEKISAFVG